MFTLDPFHDAPGKTVCSYGSCICIAFAYYNIYAVYVVVLYMTYIYIHVCKYILSMITVSLCNINII